MVLQLWMSNIVHLAVTQHYLITLSVRAQYHVLNRELRQVVEESRVLSFQPRRRGGFMTRCCSLADKVENIAKVQSELQSIMNQLGEIFGIEGLMLSGGFYILSVATVYFIYSILKCGHESLQLSFISMLLSFTLCFFSFLDAGINLFNILNLLDDHKKMERLLEERTVFAQTLDVRLEQSFESMQLQLIRNPLKIDILKIFQITRIAIAALVGSLIQHSIFLIQFDMEYF
ncbi:putative gustatory receptor 36a [Drosophila biarmipes]|uniref:putative gustatory receptor 36a n=1 Tax=Drosophila biarmipes TaxID=125945 RepID=UPI0021CC6193|nr:putative gustatory receptor 36a [Drosophila biarmipes]